mmetsp:Transcript_24759/g.71511  ORF Transcript_24759/g.71511 Transcript_24759/m.71511 type:complete len:278 (-) Transcript_24759:39-872(-)
MTIGEPKPRPDHCGNNHQTTPPFPPLSVLILSGIRRTASTSLRSTCLAATTSIDGLCAITTGMSPPMITKGIAKQLRHLIVFVVAAAALDRRVLLEQHPPPGRVEELLRPRGHTGWVACMCAGVWAIIATLAVRAHRRSRRGDSQTGLAGQRRRRTAPAAVVLMLRGGRRREAACAAAAAMLSSTSRRPDRRARLGVLVLLSLLLLVHSFFSAQQVPEVCEDAELRSWVRAQRRGMVLPNNSYEQRMVHKKVSSRSLMLVRLRRISAQSTSSPLRSY